MGARVEAGIARPTSRVTEAPFWIKNSLRSSVERRFGCTIPRGTLWSACEAGLCFLRKTMGRVAAPVIRARRAMLGSQPGRLAESRGNSDCGTPVAGKMTSAPPLASQRVQRNSAAAFAEVDSRPAAGSTKMQCSARPAMWRRLLSARILTSVRTRRRTAAKTAASRMPKGRSETMSRRQSAGTRASSMPVMLIVTDNSSSTA